MLNDACEFQKVFIACGYTDLRRGIAGLSTLVKNQFLLDPFQSGILFLFCGRRTDRIKSLLWELDGFLLLYKRLEACRFQRTRNEQEVLAITPEQYTWLMQGLSIEQTRTIKKIQPEVPL